MSLEDFIVGLPFAPDQFQLEAMAAVAEGDSVVVTAPTGAGKTLVAEAAVHIAIESGGRVFYTTPLKALSNQKYADFVATYGERGVGLLTGDNSINPEAGVVVMTTEVLRNMIYTDRRLFDRLHRVILDEVHYLEDRTRGAVWEEIIIHLPPQIPVICLSATIANPEEFVAWVRELRGPTRLVREERRPVPLERLYLVGDRHAAEGYQLLPMFVSQGKREIPNPRVVRILGGGSGKSRRFRIPRRGEVIDILLKQDLLPAIYFIFSRAACDDAARNLAWEAAPFTSRAEAEQIEAVASSRTHHLRSADLAVLAYSSWLDQLKRGVAAHHAGLVPAFKETIEELFRAGLVKVVFATETLALGINMPARSVVIERMTKFDGERHELLEPGEFTQLTGRAGRRGMDAQGTAIVPFSPLIPFERVAAIAGTGSHPLRSSFRPTYNMVVQLIANYPRELGEKLVEASFAQFQLTSEERSLSEVRRRDQELLNEARRQATCERGDVADYIQRLDAGQVSQPRARAVAAAAALRLGDVMARPDGSARAAVVGRSWTATNPHILLLETQGTLRRMRADRLGSEWTRVGRIELPTPHQPRQRWFRETVSVALAAFTLPAAPVAEITPVEGVEGCPDLERHVRWARRAARMERETQRQTTSLARRTGALVEAVRTRHRLLERLGYVEGWSLTKKGEALRRINNELDVLICEVANKGWLANLDPAELAAVVSGFVYTPRSLASAEDWPPQLNQVATQLSQLASYLASAEIDANLDPIRPPEGGFSTTAHAWASGRQLEYLFEAGDAEVGDFVRTCRQLLDLLRQLGDAFPELGGTVRASVRAIDRGVVRAGGFS